MRATSVTVRYHVARRSLGVPTPARRHCLVYGTLDGGLGAVVPVIETVYRRLQMLERRLTLGLPHRAGLNPRAFRSVTVYRPCMTWTVWDSISPVHDPARLVDGLWQGIARARLVDGLALSCGSRCRCCQPVVSLCGSQACTAGATAALRARAQRARRQPLGRVCNGLRDRPGSSTSRPVSKLPKKAQLDRNIIASRSCMRSICSMF